jgi:hypothetical protein
MQRTKELSTELWLWQFDRRGIYGRSKWMCELLGTLAKQLPNPTVSLVKPVCPFFVLNFMSALLIFPIPATCLAHLPFFRTRVAYYKVSDIT